MKIDRKQTEITLFKLLAAFDTSSDVMDFSKAKIPEEERLQDIQHISKITGVLRNLISVLSKHDYDLDSIFYSAANPNHTCLNLDESRNYDHLTEEQMQLEKEKALKRVDYVFDQFELDEVYPELFLSGANT
ncbi:MAG: hypothetical protein RH860_00130 [Cytophagales bacterium]